MDFPIIFLVIFAVAPFVGAWIEINGYLVDAVAHTGRSLHGSVD